MATKNIFDRKAAPPVSPRPTRHGIGGALAVGLVCFFLPWVQLSCGELSRSGEKTVHFTVTQSGFQATYGGASFVAGTKTEEEIRGKYKQTDLSGTAPLIVLFALLLLSALIANYIFRDEMTRLNLVLGLSAAAALIWVIAKIPLADRIARESRTDLSLFVDIHYTVWYVIALGAAIASFLLAALQWLQLRQRE